MADVLINEQKFGDFNSPLQATTIVQHQANGDFSEALSKEVSIVGERLGKKMKT
jgi:hypothetical protein